MDHLGIREFFYMGYCIGGCFAGKLSSERPSASSLLYFARPSGTARSSGLHVQFRSGCLGPRTAPAPARSQYDASRAYLHNLYR